MQPSVYRQHSQVYSLTSSRNVLMIIVLKNWFQMYLETKVSEGSSQQDQYFLTGVVPCVRQVVYFRSRSVRQQGYSERLSVVDATGLLSSHCDNNLL